MLAVPCPATASSAGAARRPLSVAGPAGGLLWVAQLLGLVLLVAKEMASPSAALPCRHHLLPAFLPTMADVGCFGL